MANILLTGGRAPAALDLARSFHAAGHTVVMAESARGHLSAPSSALSANYYVPPPRQEPDAFIQALQRIVLERKIDLLIPTCEEVFYIARGRDALAPHCAVFVEPLERLRPLHHKGLFFDLARRYGLPVPETILLHSQADLSRAFARWPHLVLKPVYSRFASRVLIKPTPAQAIAALDVFTNVLWVAQEYIAGKQICTYSIAHQGRLTAHAAYRSNFTAGPGATLVFQHFDHPSTLDWVQRLVAALRFTGQIAFDFIEDGTGRIFALECNPRATSGVHLFAAAPNFTTAFLNPNSPCLFPPPAISCMLLTGMVLYGLPASLKQRRLAQWCTTFFTSRDVVFNRHDPLPALLQWRSILHFFQVARKHRLSLLQASTFDIEWNGES